MNQPNEPKLRDTTCTITGITSKIKRTAYQRVEDSTTTLCLMYLDNGFLLIGKSACVDPKKFNQALGEKYAYEDAISKLWELEGYVLATRLKEGDIYAD
jgi:hypothetical protein